MKITQILFLFLFFMSCINKSSNSIIDVTKEVISSDLTLDTIELNIKKQKASKIILKIKVIENEGGSKYNWVKVKVLSTIKNDTKKQIPDVLSIAFYSWFEGLQENSTYIVYLVPFPLGSEDIIDMDRWILLEGNGLVGAEFIK